MKVLEEREYWAYCDVCGQGYKNWAGSTPCCGSLATVYNEKYYRPHKIERIIKKINK